MSRSILQLFRNQHPPSGPGLVVSPRFCELSEKPGYLSHKDGSKELRNLYVDGSPAHEPSLLSDFGLACFLGLYEEVKKMVESGTAPDICGHETSYRQGYLTIVVHGKRGISESTFPNDHGKVAEFLIEHGAPLDAVDITWHSALQHATILGLVQPLASILLKAGADPNHRNKYGCTALMDSCLSGSIASIELLMEHGADPEIEDADGFKPSVFSLHAGPQVSAVLEKWKRKRSGAGPALRENKSCDGCKELKTSLNVCARCKVALYCSKTCQSADWSTHKPNCHPFNEETSLTLKPFYPSGANVVLSTSSMIRTGMGYPDPSKGKTSSSGAKAPSKNKYPKQAVIKVQLAFAGPNASPTQQAHAEQTRNCLVYTKKRDFVCQFRPIDNRDAWKSLIKVIKTKGVGGLKAYFAAEIRSEYEIVVKVSEVLAEQSF